LNISEIRESGLPGCHFVRDWQPFRSIETGSIEAHRERTTRNGRRFGMDGFTAFVAIIAALMIGVGVFLAVMGGKKSKKK
jgi:hypothetical protein